MKEPLITEKEQAELEEILEIAKLAEQKAKEMSDFATGMSLKWEKRLWDANRAKAQKQEESEK